MKLNAEQIIKALECCVKSECNKCPLRDGRCANGEMGRLALAIINKLTEENERLKARVLEENHLRHQAEEMLANGMSVVRADTVRKMHSEIKQRCTEGGIYPAFVARVIDEVVKEILKGEDINARIYR